MYSGGGGEGVARASQSQKIEFGKATGRDVAGYGLQED